MKQIFTLLLFCSLILPGCTNLPSITSSTATATLTPVSTLTPTKTLTPTSSSSSSSSRSTVTIEPYSNLFPLHEQISLFSYEQISQVRDCAIENLATQRYPESESIDELIYLFIPETSCDWAALAYAYSVHLENDEKKPDIAKNAFSRAIADNPAFALSTPLFYQYLYDNFTIVDYPETLNQEITKVRIIYEWGGMGEQVEYTVDIRQANSDPSVTVTNYIPATVNENLRTKVDKDTVQALRTSLVNLLPIDSQFSLLACYDNYPDWVTTITLEDGTIIELRTNGSNMIYIGGPWQLNIDGQDYVQFSIEFIKAMDTLIQEIGLPFGQPMAMFCGGSDVLGQAYP